MGSSEQTIAICASHGIDLEERAAGGGAWLFGSRAAGCARENSDWDVLIVAPREARAGREKVGKVDLVTVADIKGTRERWLVSELSAHVAHYGQLLTGSENWMGAIDSKQAGQRKLVGVRAQIAGLARAWETLTPYHRVRWSRDLRRDIQRGIALYDQQTVPPTRVLDDLWLESTQRERRTLAIREGNCTSEVLLRAICASGIEPSPAG